jgi:hypothetical protein
MRFSGCFHRLMQALPDDQEVEVLERKIDEGFDEMRREFNTVRTEIGTRALSSERGLRSEIVAARSEARADFRTLIAVVFAMWVATVATLGVLAAHI